MNFLHKGGTIGINSTEFQTLVDNAAASTDPNDKFNISFLNLRSVGGYVFRITSNNLNNLKTVFGGINGIVQDGCEIIIKLVNLEDPLLGINLGDMHNDKEIATMDTFTNEVNTQNEIWANSLDYDYEPICPQIIKSYIVRYRSPSLHNLANSFNESTDKDTFIDIIRRYVNYVANRSGRDLTDVKDNVRIFGILVMEFMRGSTSIKSIFTQQRYDALNSPPNYYIRDDLQRDEKDILTNYLYTLCRLYKLGYAHGDPHLENALAYRNYTYINNCRIYLIDFGRTYRISNDPNYDIDSINIDLIFGDNLFPGGILFWSYRQNYRYALEMQGIYGSLSNFYNGVTNYIINDNRKKYLINLMTNIQLKNQMGEIYNLFKPTIAYNSIINQQFCQNLNLPCINITNNPLNNLMINVNLNRSFLCCPTGKSYQYILPAITSYDLNFITENYSNGNIYITYPEENENFRSNAGIYLWIFGVGDLGTGIYMIESSNCFEITSKHCILAHLCGITSLYAAGELHYQVNDDGSRHADVNLQSGTYMYTSLQNNTMTQQQFNNIKAMIGPFIKKVINRNRNVADPEISVAVVDDSFINRQNYCDNNQIMSRQYNKLERMHHLYNRLYNRPLINGYNDMNMCENGIRNLISPRQRGGGDETALEGKYDDENKSYLDDIELGKYLNLNTIKDVVPLKYKDDKGNVIIDVVEEMEKNKNFKDNMICLFNLIFKKKKEAVNLNQSILKEKNEYSIDEELKLNSTTEFSQSSMIDPTLKSQPLDYTKLIKEPSAKLENLADEQLLAYGGFNRSKKYNFNKRKIKTRKLKYKRMKHRKTAKYHKVKKYNKIRKNKMTKNIKKFKNNKRK